MHRRKIRASLHAVKPDMSGSEHPKSLDRLHGTAEMKRKLAARLLSAFSQWKTTTWI